MKYLDNVSDEEIVELNIPTGVPLVYLLNDDLEPLQKFYLGDPEAVEERRPQRSPTRARRRSMRRADASAAALIARQPDCRNPAAIRPPLLRFVRADAQRAEEPAIVGW